MSAMADSREGWGCVGPGEQKQEERFLSLLVTLRHLVGSFASLLEL